MLTTLSPVIYGLVVIFLLSLSSIIIFPLIFLACLASYLLYPSYFVSSFLAVSAAVLLCPPVLLIFLNVPPFSLSSHICCLRSLVLAILT